jgi:hypothetical protein
MTLAHIRIPGKSAGGCAVFKTGSQVDTERGPRRGARPTPGDGPLGGYVSRINNSGTPKDAYPGSAQCAVDYSIGSCLTTLNA